MRGTAFDLSKESQYGVTRAKCANVEDEHLTCVLEDDGCLGSDHVDVLVGLHDLLDAGKRQVVVLEIGGGLDLAPFIRNMVARPAHMASTVLEDERI
jgi:hypothetical protein